MTQQWTAALRPQELTSIASHEDPLSTLREDIRLGHCRHLLVTGPSGVGKTTTASNYAKALLCSSAMATGSACLTCENCAAFRSRSLIDYHEVDCQNGGGKDDIEFLLEEEINARPWHAKRHVVLFEEADGLSRAAQSRLLVPLQRDDKPWCFIFTCIDADALMSPLRDRCRILRLQLPTEAEATAFLRKLAADQQVTIDDEAVHLIAVLSQGYRQLTEHLEAAHQLAAGSVVTADLVREQVFADRSQQTLAYLEATARGHLDEALEAISAMSLTPAEKVAAIRDVLGHLLRHVLRRSACR